MRSRATTSREDQRRDRFRVVDASKAIVGSRTSTAGRPDPRAPSPVRPSWIDPASKVNKWLQMVIDQQTSRGA
jgi:hypothetical protein